MHHGSDEAFAVLAGRLTVLVGTERRLLEAGDFVLVPAGTTHTFATVGDDPVSVLAVMTPEVDALVQALHRTPADEHPAVWARHRSAVVA